MAVRPLARPSQLRFVTYTRLLPKKEEGLLKTAGTRRSDSVVFVARIDHGRGRGDGLALAQAHDDHTLRGAAEPLDVLDGDLDHGADGRAQQSMGSVANNSVD